ncbi:MAG: diguanylate cyclase domain-containing protein [Sulfuriferula sp.]
MLPEDSGLPEHSPAVKSLARVLDRSERIKEVVEGCAEDLSAVNSVLKQELSSQSTQPKVETALQQSDIVVSKVQDCADDLATVNQALEEEVKERQMLEHQLIDVKKQEETARHAAFHDPLTTLPNRVLFNDRLEHGLAQAKRHGWTLAVMFIDLNDFKAINDTYGHIVGDQVLQMVAIRLKSMTREDDTVSRHGGDEFLYLLLELKNKEAAGVIAQKIVETVGLPCEVSVNEQTVSLSIGLSIGIAIFPADGNTADELVSGADKAMYSAKREQTGYAFAKEPA